MKVAFIGKVSQEWMGALNYFKNLLFALHSVKTEKLTVIVFLGTQVKPEIKKMFSDVADEIVQLDYFNEGNFFRNCDRVLNKFFKRYVILDAILKQHKIDVLSHSAMCGFKSVKTLNWIPDFQYLFLPQMFSEAELKKRHQDDVNLCERSDLIVLSSFDAFEHLKTFSAKNIHKARVLQFVSQPKQNYFSLSGNSEVKLREKYSITGEFFYLPNQFWKHKNHITLFQAVLQLKEQGQNVVVVCTGHLKDYRNTSHIDDLQLFLEKNDLYNHIKLLGLVDYEDVFALMKYSKAVINPSLFEGWSSTVEECKSVGKSMILSDLEVHKEQYPQAVFFERENPKSLANALLSYQAVLSDDQSVQADLRKRTQDFAKTYIQIVEDCIQC